MGFDIDSIDAKAADRKVQLLALEKQLESATAFAQSLQSALGYFISLRNAVASLDYEAKSITGRRLTDLSLKVGSNCEHLQQELARVTSKDESLDALVRVAQETLNTANHVHRF